MSGLRTARLFFKPITDPMLQPWRNGTVLRIADETHNTRRFWIQVPELESFSFQPGQFVTLDLPIHEKANKRWRSYSIASWPDNSNIFELIILRLEEGAGTNYLFNEVKEGAVLPLRGPQGVFVMPATLDRDLYLICTGTGVAPFRSMVQHIKKAGLPHQQIHLFYGCRSQKDLLYADEFRQLEKELPGFQYHPTLSRESWEGHTGYVHAHYENVIKRNTVTDAGGNSTVPPAYFLLCGWRNMIDEAREKLLALGYDKKSIHQEIYG